MNEKFSLRNAALNLLAMREHSKAELATKLKRKHPELESEFSAVFEKLEAEGLLSEERYTETFVKSKVAAGDGPLKIRAALLKRGVNCQLVSHELAKYRDNWVQRAQDVLARKYQSDNSANDAAKQMRFLHQRGFSTDVCRQAVEQRQRDGTGE